jgi:hypothetical protein
MISLPMLKISASGFTTTVNRLLLMIFSLFLRTNDELFAVLGRLFRSRPPHIIYHRNFIGQYDMLAGLIAETLRQECSLSNTRRISRHRQIARPRQFYRYRRTFENACCTNAYEILSASPDIMITARFIIFVVTTARFDFYIEFAVYRHGFAL